MEMAIALSILAFIMSSSLVIGLRMGTIKNKIDFSFIFFSIGIGTFAAFITFCCAYPVCK